jgi:hypothetical protein
MVVKVKKEKIERVSNSCHHISGLWIFLLGLLIILNYWAGIAWSVFIGGFIALFGLYKYIRNG